jgi:PP-loop superfamily ATP-utilizing enzyme
MTEEIVPALSETLDEEPAIRDAEAAVHHGTMAESQVEMAETELRRLGLRNARVQHFGELACVIVSPCDIPVIAVEPMRSEVVNLIQSAGFSVVALDMTGTPRSLR